MAVTEFTNISRFGPVLEAKFAALPEVAWNAAYGLYTRHCVRSGKARRSPGVGGPFTSAVDVAARHYWFAPVRLFMKDQFRSDLHASRVKAPVLVVHGENDAIVPIALGKRLYALIQAPKRFVRVEGAGHNDLGVKAVAAAKEFIAEK